MSVVVTNSDFGLDTHPWSLHYTAPPRFTHLHETYWLAACYSEIINTLTLPYIYRVLRLMAFCLHFLPLKMGPLGCCETSIRN